MAARDLLLLLLLFRAERNEGSDCNSSSELLLTGVSGGVLKAGLRLAGGGGVVGKLGHVFIDVSTATGLVARFDAIIFVKTKIKTNWGR